MLSYDEVQSLLVKIKKVRIAVVGDVCLDLYWRADMTRSKLSRETPHYPLPVVDEQYSPGGCGNVMNNVRALEVAELIPISMIGDDWRGFLLRTSFEKLGIPTEGLMTRSKGVTPCYCKPLRMGISDVVYEDPRLDFENYEPLCEEDEKALICAIEAAADKVDIIAVSDQFSCGVITPKVRKVLSRIAESIPVVVDSREHITEYTGVIVKPNEVEAAAAIGRNIIGLNLGVDEYKEIAKTLQTKNGCPVVVTLGEYGALWCEKQQVSLVSTVKAEPPIDIVGAGDTFLSAFCLAYAAGGDGEKALALANLASGVTVKKIGTTGTAAADEILAKWEEYYK